MLIRKKIKAFIRKIIKIIPFRYRRIILYQIAATLKKNDGQILEYDIFDLKILQGLKPENEYMKTYKNSLLKAGDQNTDNIYKILRHLNLYSYIEDVLKRKIPGDFAECGCWNGNSLFATKYFIDKYKSDKNIHIFDSFEGGLSEFSKEDYEGSFINSRKEADKLRSYFYSSYEKLLSKIENMTNIFINKGWIPDVFKNQKDRKYSFVHIDLDLYEPTKEAHIYFFERLQKGGIIVCDDYGYEQFPGASKAVDQFVNSLPSSSYTYFIKHSIGTSVIIK